MPKPRVLVVDDGRWRRYTLLEIWSRLVGGGRCLRRGRGAERLQLSRPQLVAPILRISPWDGMDSAQAHGAEPGLARWW